MSQLPMEPKKIKERIARYERELRKEYERFGAISDGSGKRYLLGPLYLLLGDLAGAIRSFEWFDRMFPGDMGEPVHTLCWALALYRSGDAVGATHRLLLTMLDNLYVIPHLLGLEQARLDIWHGTNLAEPSYLQYIPSEYWALWDQPALQWAKETYHSPEFRRIRARHIEIYRRLRSEPPGPRRSQLVAEVFALRSRRGDPR